MVFGNPSRLKVMNYLIFMLFAMEGSMKMSTAQAGKSSYLINDYGCGLVYPNELTGMAGYH